MKWKFNEKCIYKYIQCRYLLLVDPEPIDCKRKTKFENKSIIGPVIKNISVSSMGQKDRLLQKVSVNSIPFDFVFKGIVQEWCKENKCLRISSTPMFQSGIHCDKNNHRTQQVSHLYSSLGAYMSRGILRPMIIANKKQSCEKSIKCKSWEYLFASEIGKRTCWLPFCTVGHHWHTCVNVWQHSMYDIV